MKKGYLEFSELKVGDRVRYYSSLENNPGEGVIVSLDNIHTIELEVAGKVF
jgi:hypothetical protein